MKGIKPQHLDEDDVGIQTSMPKTSKGPKFVIHLGSQNKNIADSPKYDASSCQKEQELATSNGKCLSISCLQVPLSFWFFTWINLVYKNYCMASR